MVILTLLLAPRVNRIVSFLYLITILVSCIGETWVYYLLVEVVLLVIARAAWRWPSPTVAPSLS
ncbi:hypothetical protein B0I31_10259 [Saccharothrix carnea]|uniref:Uncharacterized protein n=1 Tax=Saccharothrix carnea TaxID=1280637 RepID=A0A2P8IF49_SACCR|nr:hypothetical protein [Saccharothrix carnea]PSL57082.1 hypothetical protein B0I31_10259 [Saccharothrix carnea]